jgi:aspartate racemase
MSQPGIGEKTVGILGGLGPEATLDLYAKILAASGARTDQEHLHVLIDSNPKVPDRNKAIAGTGEPAAPALVAMARRLEQAGADFLVMACNTAHAFDAEIRAAVRVPFVSMIEEACEAVARAMPTARRVGLLAVQGCLDAKVYHRAFSRRGWTLVALAPPQQARFMDLVYRIKSGDTGAAIGAEMVGLGGTLFAAGAEVVLAGCTEVPLVVGAADLPGPLVDATQVLAERTVAYAKGRVALPVLATA